MEESRDKSKNDNELNLKDNILVVYKIREPVRFFAMILKGRSWAYVEDNCVVSLTDTSSIFLRIVMLYSIRAEYFSI